VKNTCLGADFRHTTSLIGSFGTGGPLWESLFWLSIDPVLAKHRLPQLFNGRDCNNNFSIWLATRLFNNFLFIFIGLQHWQRPSVAQAGSASQLTGNQRSTQTPLKTLFNND
jgi:hypothetical protein